MAVHCLTAGRQATTCNRHAPTPSMAAVAAPPANAAGAQGQNPRDSVAGAMNSLSEERREFEPFSVAKMQAKMCR